MSAVFTQAIAHWRQLRAEFELYREHAYARAEDACAGVLLNSAAQREGISAWSLFIGPEARAFRWASDELREH
ncbi:hypothetical protein [Sanguibacter massiliensis]|uniref:hypothetical protein n=1 Tax=Sanguibacter massiliensis TaxID=1973217 RepID=UPI000C84027C|nr:hypothetical protein [Sanguibacter massiliensis]